MVMVYLRYHLNLNELGKIIKSAMSYLNTSERGELVGSGKQVAGLHIEQSQE